MKKISVIIPICNVDRYIRKCLESVINQTYKNLEILCIDDGSTDNSGNILEEYALDDQRIKTFHKKNGGLSSALNIGLENASGDYIGFLDADDWIEEDMYEILYNQIETHKTIVSVVNYFKDFDTKVVPMLSIEKISNAVLSKEEMLHYAFRGNQYVGFNFAVWNKLFLADTISKNDLRFDEGLTSGMDAVFTTSVILSERCTGIYTNQPLYHYYQRSASLSNSNNVNIRISELKALKTVIDLANENGFEEISVWQKRHHCYLASLLAESALQQNKWELLSDMQNEMELYIKEYLMTNKEFPERIERMQALFKVKRSDK